MADDFARLVFQANPASSRNSHINVPMTITLLPPSRTIRMLPQSCWIFFFDDEDEGDPLDSTFADMKEKVIRTMPDYGKGQS